MNVVFIGDLLQLPPVKGAHVFEPINNKTIQSNWVGLHDLDQYLAKDDRIRRADDQRKAKERQTLFRTFEQIRCGSRSDDDVEALQGRVIDCTT